MLHLARGPDVPEHAVGGAHGDEGIGHVEHLTGELEPVRGRDDVVERCVVDELAQHIVVPDVIRGELLQAVRRGQHEGPGVTGPDRRQRSRPAMGLVGTDDERGQRRREGATQRTTDGRPEHRELTAERVDRLADGGLQIVDAVDLDGPGRPEEPLLHRGADPPGREVRLAIGPTVAVQQDTSARSTHSVVHGQQAAAVRVGEVRRVGVLARHPDPAAAGPGTADPLRDVERHDDGRARLVGPQVGAACLRARADRPHARDPGSTRGTCMVIRASRRLRARTIQRRQGAAREPAGRRAARDATLSRRAASSTASCRHPRGAGP